MRTMLFAVALSLTAISGCSKSEPAGAAAAGKKDELPTLTVDQVEKGIAANELTAVDCNGDKTRKKLGVVPGAILTSDEDYPASELPADKGRKLVFYCTDAG